MTHLGVLIVSETQTVRDIAAEHQTEVHEVDGWLHTTVGGTVYKAATETAVA